MTKTDKPIKKKTGKESDAMPSENEQIHEWMRMGGERKIRSKS